MVLPPTAQRRPGGRARGRRGAATKDTEQLDLLVGRSAVIKMDRPITRVSLSTPDIADALVTTPYELLVHGKTPGTISLLVWGDNGRIKTYDVAVKRDLSTLEAQIRKLFPGRGRSRRRATARTSCSLASSPASTSSIAPRRSRSATSRSPKTSSTCCASRKDRPPTRCCCA